MRMQKSVPCFQLFLSDVLQAFISFAKQNASYHEALAGGGDTEE